ncbi:MAG: hypothetical protein J6B48_05450 [Clostridia bacterium]|nr:hypothetical protein [Clostridia bacterium]
MNYIQQFLESIAVQNTSKVVKSVLNGADDRIKQYSVKEIEEFVLASNPNSPKAITTICYVLGLYGRWLQEQNIDNKLYVLIGEIDKKGLWKKAKSSAKNKFVSYDTYIQVISDIARYEEFNPSYYMALFKCIYDGLYSNDLSVLKNLRASDINDNLITLIEDDGHSYKIKVSPEFAYELQELATMDIWERRNRYGVCKVKMRGLYCDSVFKIEDRTTASDDAHKFTLYSKLRKISNDYLGYSLLPFHIYISGIMHRIKIKLEQHGMTLEDAFSDNNRDKLAHEIISKELIRSNYSSEIGNFREIVKGHLDAF